MTRMAGALLALAATTTVAHAHHVASDSGITPAQPRSIAEVTADGGELDQAAGQAAYLRLTPALELRLAARLSLRAQVMLVSIIPVQGAAYHGLGDTEVGAKLLIVGGGHGGALLSVGLGAKLPTGAAETGLGGGHWGLAPYAAASWESSDADVSVVLAALAVDAMSVTSHGSSLPAARIVVEPHSSHELLLVPSIALVAPRAWIATSAASTWDVDDGARFETLTGKVLAGLRLGSRYRVTMSAEAPLTGDTGYRWRSLLGLAYVAP